MPVRLRTKSDQDNITGEQTNPVTVETTYEGQTFAWGPGEQRVIGDTGIAAGHVAYSAELGANVFVDNSLVTVSPANTAPSRS